MNPGDKEAEAKFKEASEAYAVLSDADIPRYFPFQAITYQILGVLLLLSVTNCKTSLLLA